ncbi:MAG: cyclophilin-like fold protein [Thiolinea sp.]
MKISCTGHRATLLLAMILTGTIGYSHAEQTEVDETVKIVIQTDHGDIQGVLESSTAGKAFAAQLPLELTLKDYHATEKIADLPARLPTQDAPAGIKPVVGDITYFAPWGNLAIFYKDFSYSNGLVRLGRIEGDLSLLSSKDSMPVRIERVPAETANP